MMRYLNDNSNDFLLLLVLSLSANSSLRLFLFFLCVAVVVGVPCENRTVDRHTVMRFLNDLMCSTHVHFDCS